MNEHRLVALNTQYTGRGRIMAVAIRWLKAEQSLAGILHNDLQGSGR